MQFLRPLSNMISDAFFSAGAARAVEVTQMRNDLRDHARILHAAIRNIPLYDLDKHIKAHQGDLEGPIGYILGFLTWAETRPRTSASARAIKKEVLRDCDLRAAGTIGVAELIRERLEWTNSPYRKFIGRRGSIRDVPPMAAAMSFLKELAQHST